MLARMLGVARLNVATFEDVEHDSGATLQAMLIVIVVSIATGVGTMLAGEADLLKDVVFGVLRSLLSWAVWALLAWSRIPHLAQTSDAVNRQLSCFSSRYMNLLAVLQI